MIILDMSQQVANFANVKKNTTDKHSWYKDIFDLF